MAVQQALAFLRAARTDDELGRELGALEEEVGLESLARVAERAGYGFTTEELERAHALDWGMRWAHYAARPPTRPR